MFIYIQEAGLSKETFLAFQQTCRGTAALARYLILNCGFNYVLLGLIQSDNIESRFGWYRQLSGANYFISARQLFESERKIKAISLLKYSGFTVSDIDKIITKADPESFSFAESIYGELRFSIIPSQQDKLIIYYVTGACARSVVRTKNCESCKESLILADKAHDIRWEETPRAAYFLKEINRGGLCAPHDHIFHLGLLCWQVFYEVKETKLLRDIFVKGHNNRQTFCDIMELTTRENFDIFFGKDHCSQRHNLITEISARFFNCMSKNFVKSMSSGLTAAAKKRKTDKLSGSSH